MKRWIPALVIVALGAILFISLPRTMPLAEQLRHLPTNDGVIVIADGSVVKKIAGAAGSEEVEYRDFVSASGFDFRRDLDRLVAVIGSVDAYYVVAGRFDWTKISRYATAQNGSCVKDVCSLPASQPGRWISLTPLNGTALAIAVSPRQLAVADMEKPRNLVSSADVPFLLRARGKDLQRWGLGGIETVEARVDGEQLVATAQIPNATVAESVAKALEGKAPNLKRDGTSLTARWKLDESLLGKMMQ